MDEIKQNLPQNIIDALIKANMDSPNLILTSSKTSLQKLLNCSFENVELLVKVTSKVLFKNKCVRANCLRDWVKLSSGSKSIDSILQGGFSCKGVNEISGYSGVGKTQLCLQVSLVVQLPIKLGGLGKGCVYICTEDVFPSKRFNQLAEAFGRQYGISQNNLSNNVFVEHSSDYEQLRRCLCIRLPQFLLSKSIGLIILDSIAGIFRFENSEANFVSRKEDFNCIVSALNSLAKKHNCCIICTNQFTDNLELGKPEPALGLAWSNLVTSRFLVHRFESNPKRQFEVLFAPDLPSKVCDFYIRESGVS